MINGSGFNVGFFTASFFTGLFLSLEELRQDRFAILNPYSEDKFGLQEASFPLDALLKVSLVPFETDSEGNRFLVDALLARESEGLAANVLKLTSLCDKDLECIRLELPTDNSAYELGESSAHLLEDM